MRLVLLILSVEGWREPPEDDGEDGGEKDQTEDGESHDESDVRG